MKVNKSKKREKLILKHSLQPLKLELWWQRYVLKDEGEITVNEIVVLWNLYFCNYQQIRSDQQQKI